MASDSVVAVKRRITSQKQLIISILVLTFARLITSVSLRFPYPFLPAIGRQLSVPVSSVQGVVAAQSGIGVVSPLFGPLSERHGRKRVMTSCLAWIVAVSMIGIVLPQFWAFAAVLIALSLGKVVFDPAMQAYLGDRIPYRRRGLALGTTELSWAGSMIVIAPVAGYLLSTSSIAPSAEFFLDVTGLQSVPGLLVDSSGLQRVFAVIAGTGLVALALVWIYLPDDRPDRETSVRVTMPLEAWRILRHSPAALGALGYYVLLITANQIFFINYGIWMEQSFDLVLAQLGAATTVIAIAEVTGEFTVIGFSDRFGKRRFALWGAVFSSIAYVALPFLTFNLNAALIGLFFAFLMVETAIVAAIPLFTEVLPDARSVMMSGVVGASSMGRLVGALLGGLIYAVVGNFTAVGLIAMCVGLMAVVLMWRFVHEHSADESAQRPSDSLA